MAVASVGQVGGEAAGFRKLLERAEGDDGARSEALDLVLARSMQVATWPESSEALRTLRNGKGELALALWSGGDVLAVAAAQLGWRAGDGSLPARTVDARDAIEAALAQGAQFVVIDLGSDHALELARDEVALLLAVKQKQSPKAASAPQAGPAGPQAGPQAGQAAPQAKGLTDFDLPFIHGRSDAAAAGPPRPEVVAQTSADMLARAFAAPTEDGPGSKGGTQAAGAQPMTPATPAQAVAAPAPLAARAPAQAQAPEAASSKTSVGAQRTMIGHAAPAPAPAPKPQAAEDKPVPGRPAAKTLSEEGKPSAIKSAARALATMMGSGEQAHDASSDEASSAEAEQAPVFAEGALRPLDLGLSEAALGAVAEALRGYPEVEWACEVSDGTEVPVIGVRVSPQFMTRAAQIEQATLAAGTARGAELRVLLLSDAAVMREARTHGAAFFPWKKRK